MVMVSLWKDQWANSITRMHEGISLSKPVALKKPVELAYYSELQAQVSLLTWNELNLVMLRSIMATTRSDQGVTYGRHKPVKRQRPSASYLHSGCKVYKVTFVMKRFVCLVCKGMKVSCGYWVKTVAKVAVNLLEPAHLNDGDTCGCLQAYHWCQLNLHRIVMEPHSAL